LLKTPEPNDNAGARKAPSVQGTQNLNNNGRQPHVPALKGKGKMN